MTHTIQAAGEKLPLRAELCITLFCNIKNRTQKRILQAVSLHYIKGIEYVPKIISSSNSTLNLILLMWRIE
jgi:hypothetical protein